MTILSLTATRPTFTASIAPVAPTFAPAAPLATQPPGERVLNVFWHQSIPSPAGVGEVELVEFVQPRQAGPDWFRYTVATSRNGRRLERVGFDSLKHARTYAYIVAEKLAEGGQTIWS